MLDYVKPELDHEKGHGVFFLELFQVFEKLRAFPGSGEQGYAIVDPVLGVQGKKYTAQQGYPPSSIGIIEEILELSLS